MHQLLRHAARTAAAFALYAATSVAFADGVPATYVMTFTGTNAPVPATFTYDADTNTFGSFDVVFGGVTFNMTPETNFPDVVKAGTCGTTTLAKNTASTHTTAHALRRLGRPVVAISTIHRGTTVATTSAK